jgi:hypothetical protein
MTVSFNGTRITEAESTNSWFNEGGADMTLETDFVKQGAFSISKAVSGAGGLEWNVFDVTGSTDFAAGLDFTSDGAQYGQVIFIWGYCTTGTLINTREAGGMRIYLGTASTNADIYYVDGQDTYPSGWVKYVIDPTKTPSAIEGNGGSASNVQYIGMGILTTGNVKANNIAIDAIEVGYGMEITGSATDGWEDIIDFDVISTNQYGIFRDVSGVIFGRGQLSINAANWEDQGRTVIWEAPTYWQDSDNPDAPCVSTDFFKLTVSGASTFTEGVAVGTSDTQAGRTGMSYQSVERPVLIDFSDSDIASVNIYGNTYTGMKSGIILNPNGSTDNEFSGVSVAQSGQLDPGAAIMRNGVFAENDTDADSALLWGSTINVKNYQFIANSHGIEHDVNATDVIYDNLSFSGNVFDINFSSSDQLFINAKNGANPASVDETGGSSDWTIDNPVFHTLTGVIEASEVTYITTDNAELYHVESSATDGLVQYSYNYTSDKPIEILIMNVDYEPVALTGITLGAVDASVVVQMSTDPNYYNP